MIGVAGRNGAALCYGLRLLNRKQKLFCADGTIAGLPILLVPEIGW